MAIEQDYRFESSDGESLNIENLIKGLIKWWKIIVASAIAFAILGFAFARVTYTPTYTAAGTMIVSARRTASESYVATFSDLSMSQQLANTFTIVLQSDTLMQDVVRDLQLDLPIEYLKRCIRIQPINELEVMQIAVTTNSYELSVNIANSVMKLAPKIISEKVNMGSIKPLDEPQEAVLNSPSTAKFTFIGFLLGFVLSVGLVLILELMRDTVKGTEDVQTRLNLSVYGNIPAYQKKTYRKQGEITPLLSAPAATFPFIEAYKALRTRVELYSARNDAKTILITSTMEKEGKTTTSTNLAIAMAQKGKKVVIVDADMRKPKIAKRLNLGEIKKGLGDILKGEASLAEVLRQDKEHGLFVVPSRKFEEQPSELLNGEEMKKLLATLNEEYDCVIIDTPPAGYMIDAIVLAELVDMALLVVKSDTVSVKEIGRVIEDFANAGRPISGAIINYHMNDGGRSYKYRYKYRYNYSYGSNK